MQFSPTSCHFISLLSKYSPSTSFQTPLVYVPPFVHEFCTQTKLITNIICKTLIIINLILNYVDFKIKNFKKPFFLHAYKFTKGGL
jgi:hypothetical protein